MKKFLINLFKIEQYFYISAIGFKGKNNLSYCNSIAHATGGLNIEIVRQNIMHKCNFDSIHIVNIISISKKQYNELNK